MPSAAKTSLPDKLQALEQSLSTLWLAPVFPMRGTTTASVRRRAKMSGQRALRIQAAAEAAGDEETARAAVKLAKRLVPYLNANVISWGSVHRAETRRQPAG